MEIKIMKNILYCNNKLAEENRELLNQKGIVSINILASPGAGKTSLILRIIEALRDKIPMAVVEGDIAGSIDAEKIDKLGVPVVQINTGGGCHLDANMFKEAINSLNPPEGCLIFIENVGNLVCPASFDLGESGRLVLSSTAEGSDKPVKYPQAFQTADVVVLNKVDLIRHIEFERDFFYKGITAVSKAPVFEVSCTTREGLTELLSWLEDFYNSKRGQE